MFANYEELIRAFLREELRRGQINEDLILLYRYYFEELLEDERSRQDLGNIIFVRQLICDNEFIQKAEISQDGRRIWMFVTSEKKRSYVEIFDEHASFVFFDSEGKQIHWISGLSVKTNLDEGADPGIL